ncbi:hypothetical protein BJ684DRAFT_22137 [Piptocephalis cylindrospora]|uniref:MTTase N-terminal domain-containing protein n=1 Tax=Piptocephalis cylindrospora TaxID=1907219 RepID=A0A4P9Y0L5_9FUNG|nr:hypothetical protein BJ684DRAFT_22137 [Piptocephalis cylindrospora]|eukprot:RKP11310.1 hypothetical protein BJ684DRAFT_22137 [Piptocephalis cylindrospora]
MHQGTMELREDKDRAPVVPEWAPYLKPASEVLKPKKYHVEVYGCQMNYNDTEILMSVLDAAGYEKVDSPKDANVIFLMTCAIRDNAEKKIWNRLETIRARIKQEDGTIPMIGVLGCMAERLKERLFDRELVDIVCGPDAYSMADKGANVANVMLSADETYADIHPVRKNDTISAHLSIMR